MKPGPVRLGPCLALAAMTWWAATPARAQITTADPVSESQFRFGALGINPGVVFVAGYDSNLNGEVTEVIGGPQVFAIPQVRAWTQLRRFVVGGAAAAEFIQVKDQEDITTLTGQPAANLLAEALVGSSSDRFSWTGIAQRKDTSAKPTGFENGARSRRVEKMARVNAALDLAGRLSLGFATSALRTAYDADAVYADSPLHETLNSMVSMATVTAGYELTPVTSVFVGVDVRKDKFYVLPERDTTATSLGGGVSFDPGGLFSGQVFVAQRKSSTPGFETGQLDGLVVQGLVVHTRPSGMAVSLTLTQDRAFSFDKKTGTYEIRGGEVNWTLPIGYHWRAFVMGAYHNLDYTSRIDTNTQFGGGISNQISPRVRVGAYGYNTKHIGGTPGGQSWDSLVINAFIVYGTSGQVRPLDRPLPP